MPKNNSEESLEEKLSKVHIPEPEEFVRRAAGIQDFYGLLFADDQLIKYAVLNNNRQIKNIYLIKETNSDMLALLAVKDDIYFEHKDSKIHSLFGKFRGKEGGDPVESLVEHDGKIVDAGDYGIYETIPNKHLMEMDDFTDLKVNTVRSLSSFKNKLYALVAYNTYNNTKSYFVELAENNGKYHMNNIIIDYDDGGGEICQAVILPDVLSKIKGKQYDFSVLSCAYNDYLDLNGEKIEGTEEDYDYIFRLALLSSDSERAEVAYSGDLREIKLAKINLKHQRAKTEMLIPDLSDTISALEVVRNAGLHKHLISIGNKIR